jgi:hypothetical protein
VVILRYKTIEGIGVIRYRAVKGEKIERDIKVLKGEEIRTENW